MPGAPLSSTPAASRGLDGVIAVQTRLSHVDGENDVLIIGGYQLEELAGRVTGGPGAGKTTLLTKLASMGYATVKETARAIIAERLASGLILGRRLEYSTLLDPVTGPPGMR